MAIPYSYRVRPADRFFRSDNPDAHEIQEYDTDTDRVRRATSVYRTYDTAQRIADVLNSAAGERIG